jgi:hypothetical protein
MRAAFEKALAGLGYTKSERRSEPRIRVFERRTGAGNVARIVLDLAGVAPPWQPAAHLEVTSVAASIRLEIARQARVVSESTWNDRIETIVNVLRDVDGRDLNRADELLGPAPAWFASLSPGVFRGPFTNR